MLKTPKEIKELEQQIIDLDAEIKSVILTIEALEKKNEQEEKNISELNRLIAEYYERKKAGSEIDFDTDFIQDDNLGGQEKFYDDLLNIDDFEIM